MEGKLKVLVFRLSSMGDIIWASPVLRMLKQQLGAEVHFSCKSQFATLIEDNPNVDKVWAWDKQEEKFTSYCERLKAEGFDGMIDLHNNFRSHIMARMLKVKTKVFDKLRWQKWLMVHLKVNTLPEVHIVDRYVDTISHLGIYNDRDGMDFYIHSSNTINPIKWGYEKNHYAVMVVGAAHYTKRVPNSQLIPLLNHINVPLVLIGGGEDVEKAAHMEANICGNVLNMVGKLNLQQSASWIQQAGMVLAPDTGMMHIAAALKRPLVVFWGNTIEEFGIWPYYGRYKVPYLPIQVDLPCRPCDKIGKKKCPKGHFKCMKYWNPMEIAEMIDLFWKSECLPYINSKTISKK